MKVVKSKKNVPVEYQFRPVFFSLIDYRNNYFMSSDPNKIVEFYNGFENRDQLINWMTERAKGIANIHEVDGEKNIIVVIPTANFSGKYAIECKENIFKGLHLIFVESGEIPDFYFNYAHNCNIGIRKAMEYNPKWIIVSNDDMKKIDDVTILKRELLSLDSSTFDAVFVRTENKLPKKGKIARPNFFYKFTQILRFKYFSKERKEIREKFHIFYLPVPLSTVAYKYLFTGGKTMLVFKDLIILSLNFVKNEDCIVFDETFINDSEDNDLAIRLRNRGKTTSINYSIKSIGAISLGISVNRLLRSLASEAYLNDKLEKFLNLKST